MSASQFVDAMHAARSSGDYDAVNGLICSLADDAVSDFAPLSFVQPKQEPETNQKALLKRLEQGP